ncbi:MAG: DUF4249 domain-containing protein [Bacteroidales bacterium]|nr:DUF4249 domain-containing protein [Bacteroidales bacterium]
MKHLKLILGFVLATVLASCTKEIEFTGEQSESRLVVNGLQQVGQPARLCVEKSVFFVDSQKDCRVKDVHVDLYVNGVFKESLQVQDSMLYETYQDLQTYEMAYKLMYAFNYCEGQYLLCEGDELRFEVGSSEFDTATAEVKMPEAPHVISFDTVRIEPLYEYGLTVHFALKLDDPAGSDYYNFRPDDGLAGFYSSDPVFKDLTDIEDIEDVFGESAYYGNGHYNTFSDLLFDGSEYTVSLENNMSGTVFYEPFTLEVTRLDAGLYQYIKSYNSYENSDPGSILGMFTEPVQVYSNVKNAIGVVGAQSQPVIMTIDLTEN